ncbi:MAG: hypothetical protein PVG56_01470 [Anaerolineae bacterium]
MPLWVAWTYSPFLNDDALVTLTYAKNLAAGRGFVYNQGPASLGTTSPLLALLIAGLSIILPGVEIPTLAVFLTAFCWLGIAWTFFLFRASWNIPEWQAVVVGLVILASGWVTFLGMEAYLFAFLLVLGFSLFFARHYFLAGLATGLLLLTRGEGVLVLFVQIGFYGVAEWSEKRHLDAEMLKPLLRLMLGFFLPAVIWFGYVALTFGGILPNTLSAKRAQGQSGLWQSLPRRLLKEWLPTWGQQFAIKGYPFFSLWWVVVLIGLVSAALFRRRWLAFGAWIVLYIAGYALLKVSAYWWYQLPILFVLHLFFALGLSQSLEWLAGSRQPRAADNHLSDQVPRNTDQGMRATVTSFFDRVPRPLRVGLALVIAFFFLVGLLRPTLDAALNYEGDPRGESYVELSNWLRERVEPAESVAYIEIGYLGFYTNNQIIDLAGLLLPEITPHIAAEDFAWGFWHYEPDYYIYLPDFDWALAEIRADPRFDQRYQAVATLPGPRESDFVIFKRR